MILLHRVNRGAGIMNLWKAHTAGQWKGKLITPELSAKDVSLNLIWQSLI